MRRKLKNLKNKSGHSENGAPRTLIDLAFYYSFRNYIRVSAGNKLRDSEYGGWNNPSRPNDMAVSLVPPGHPVHGG
jgi:hypothetical protein